MPTSITYNVYDLVTGEPRLIAEVTDSGVTGPRADMVLRMLQKSGWPRRNPMDILHGDYCWAEEASRTFKPMAPQ